MIEYVYTLHPSYARGIYIVDWGVIIAIPIPGRAAFWLIYATSFYTSKGLYKLS